MNVTASCPDVRIDHAEAAPGSAGVDTSRGVR
jgi:hypothetical protein